MQKDITVSVEPASYDLAQGVGAFIVVVEKQLADGFQVGQDVPPVLMAAYSDLFSKAADFAQLKGELADSKVAFMRAWLNAGLDIAASLGVK